MIGMSTLTNIGGIFTARIRGNDLGSFRSNCREWTATGSRKTEGGSGNECGSEEGLSFHNENGDRSSFFMKAAGKSQTLSAVALRKTEADFLLANAARC
jgi:hypothetical protein